MAATTMTRGGLDATPRDTYGLGTAPRYTNQDSGCGGNSGSNGGSNFVGWVTSPKKPDRHSLGSVPSPPASAKKKSRGFKSAPCRRHPNTTLHADTSRDSGPRGRDLRVVTDPNNPTAEDGRAIDSFDAVHAEA